MPEYKFVCNECGNTFKGLTSHIGDEMCPACGGFDIELVPAVPNEPAPAGDPRDAGRTDT